VRHNKRRYSDANQNTHTGVDVKSLYGKRAGWGPSIRTDKTNTFVQPIVSTDQADNVDHPIVSTDLVETADQPIISTDLGDTADLIRSCNIDVLLGSGNVFVVSFYAAGNLTSISPETEQVGRPN